MSGKLLFVAFLFVAAGIMLFESCRPPQRYRPTADRICTRGHYEQAWIAGAYTPVISGFEDGVPLESQRWEPGHWQAVWICDEWEPELTLPLEPEPEASPPR